MKKTLVALAALAAFGAQAQVTLYGKIDAGVRMLSQTVGGSDSAAGNVGLQVNTAGMSGSRWGMKGTEDLGGGLNANFQLEGQFSVDTGAPATTTTFHRQSWVGLSGAFGSLSFGRQYTPLDTFWGTYDATGYSTNSAMGYTWGGAAANTTGNKGGVAGDIGRADNSILYQIPAMSGMTAQFMYGPDETKTPTKDAGAYVGFLVGYAAGPLTLHVGYENIVVKTALVAAVAATPGTDPIVVGSKAVPAVDTSTNSTMGGVSYNLGVAKLSGAIQRASNALGDDNGWMVGVNVPAGAATVSLSYSTETYKLVGNNFDGVSNAIAGHVVYPMSKRTNVYLNFLRGDATLSAAAAGAAQTVNSYYGAGVRHDF